MPNFNEKTYALFSNPTNKKIIAALENHGAKFFLFPPLETERIVFDEKSINEIKNFRLFDWIIFHDVFTADYFLEILEENEIDLFEIDAARICTFGEAVADRLRFSQIHTDLILNSFEATRIYQSFLDYIGKENLNDLKIFSINGLFGESAIKKNLTEKGAQVTELAIYQAKNFKTELITKLKVLLTGGAIDEFIFSSPTDLLALRIYFNDEAISKILAEIEVSTADSTMFETLVEQDLKPDYFRNK